MKIFDVGLTNDQINDFIRNLTIGETERLDGDLDMNGFALDFNGLPIGFIGVPLEFNRFPMDFIGFPCISYVFPWV